MVSKTPGVWKCAVGLVTAFLMIIGDSTLTMGYRPFVSTDAAVVDPGEVELELGYFNLERTDKENVFVVPQVVMNYGISQDWEVVAEFDVEKPPDAAVKLVNAGLFLKGVLKQGMLQQQKGVSVAVEAGPLLPSTAPEENGFGFEGIGILSGELHRFTYHLNIGGGIYREKTRPFVLWGAIVEWSMFPSFRLVGEINGESIRKKLPDESALVGVIWQSPWPQLLFDGGIRKGISREASDWMFTTGLTWSFSPFLGFGPPSSGGTP